MTSYPAITLWQPWASLIAASAEPYEWRGWAAPRCFIGRRIAIHAGARKVKWDEIAEQLLGLKQFGAAGTSLVPENAIPLLESWLTSPSMLPLSSIVCMAIPETPIKAAAYAAKHGGEAADSDRIDQSKGADAGPHQGAGTAHSLTGAEVFWKWTCALGGMMDAKVLAIGGIAAAAVGFCHQMRSAARYPSSFLRDQSTAEAAVANALKRGFQTSLSRRAGTAGEQGVFHRIC